MKKTVIDLAPEDRICRYCSSPLVRREGEQLQNWLNRETCGRLCSNRIEGRRKSSKGQRRFLFGRCV